MTITSPLSAFRSLFLATLLATAACSTAPVLDESEELAFEVASAHGEIEDSLQVEGEVSLDVAGSETPESHEAVDELEEIIVSGRAPRRHEVIRDLVVQAQELLQEAGLEYFFTGRGRSEVLRGRPVLFALWSERDKDWIIAHVEIPRPPVRWRPGGKPLKILVRTPGIQGRHVNGTGAERLMLSFSRDGEPLKVYGRKFPVFDSALISKRQWRKVAETAEPTAISPRNVATRPPDPRRRPCRARCEGCPPSTSPVWARSG